ncbi:MAG: hypothetical protein ETSY2_46050 [Candidatus Entotheonella gemina]|uniref:Cytochrome c domain-containing protein n=2 Tax=Candidatus Entotheonella TaxID=93171 RepID=W4LF54_9BACT|nr:MAG: hypothetical protein ETSY2_46050 [Candidatus Entotheonella gemina]
MRLFYGQAQCSQCHRGKFQTDHAFHAIAMPQIGPGKGDGVQGWDDFGRERVTGQSFDRYRFRTPSLRNVVLTGPWGHDGAYNHLEAVVQHHLEPAKALQDYDTGQAVLPSRSDLDALDFVAYRDPEHRAALSRSSEITRIRLSDRKLRALMAFLYALTDPSSLDLRKDVPERVPSGLSVFD